MMGRRAATTVCFVVPPLIAFAVASAATRFLGDWAVIFSVPVAAYLGWWSGSKVLRRVRAIGRDADVSTGP
jgi:hypothetical protein